MNSYLNEMEPLTVACELTERQHFSNAVSLSHCYDVI